MGLVHFNVLVWPANKPLVLLEEVSHHLPELLEEVDDGGRAHLHVFDGLLHLEAQRKLIDEL